MHALVASGAVSDEGRWRAGGANFLFPVRALSKMFRGKFLAGLRDLIDTNQLVRPKGNEQIVLPPRRLLRQLSKKSWVVYSNAPFAGPRKLLDYLSRHTHRVAISNDGLQACCDGQVTFSDRDRRDGDRHKEMELPADKFIGRFFFHVLPDRFVRIRLSDGSEMCWGSAWKRVRVAVKCCRQRSYLRRVQPSSGAAPIGTRAAHRRSPPNDDPCQPQTARPPLGYRYARPLPSSWKSHAFCSDRPASDATGHVAYLPRV
ncbi:MAG: transposase [Rubripirellula sp.]